MSAARRSKSGAFMRLIRTISSGYGVSSKVDALELYFDLLLISFVSIHIDFM